MKRLFITILSGLFLLSGTFCQKYAKSQFTLFSYTYKIDNKVKIELSPLESQIRFNPEKKQDKVEGMMIHSLFYFISKTLADSLEVYILPANSMSDVKYNEYGYPDINIQKAIKHADTKYYFKIHVVIENYILDEQGKKIIEDIFRPKISISIDIYNKYGYLPIQSSESNATAMGPVKISPEFLAGMNFVDNSIQNSDNTETLKDIFMKAVLEAIFKIKHKSNK
jgi:hypothetical protein